MPAEIVTGSFCADYWGVFRVQSDSDPNNFYIVTMNGGEGVAHCTCKAYEYSGVERHCKHIHYVFKNGCFWNCQWHEGNKKVNIRPIRNDLGNIIPKEKCPNCGGPVVAVKIAV